MIKEVKIDGFRGFADVGSLMPAIPTGEPGSGLTIIVGPNNSGKSTITEIFRMRRKYDTPSFNMGVRNTKNDIVKIEYHFEDHYEIIESISKGSSETKIRKFDDNDTIDESSEIYYVPSRRYFSPYFGKAPAFNRSDFVENYNRSTNDRQSQIVNFEGRLLQIEKDQSKFNNVIRKVIPDLLSWSIDQSETGQYFLKFFSDYKSHSSAGVGDGIVSVFVIIAAIYDSTEKQTIVIDEPELSLHPTIQKRLINVLQEYSNDRQIIIATHSPYFITKESIRNGCVICRSWDRNGTIEIFQTSINDPDSGLDQLTKENIQNPHSFGLEAKEVFFLEDNVLILEGQEDVVLWPKLLRNSNDRNYEIFGWGAGGSSNIKHVISVLDKLGFKKIAAILDNDRPTDLDYIKNKFPNLFSGVIPAADIRTKKEIKHKTGKVGLLDEEYNVRDELSDSLHDLLAKLKNFMAPRSS